MSFAEYAKNSAGEALLVLISAWAMSTVGFNAFELDGIATLHPLIAFPLTLVLVAILYAAAYRRSRWLFGAVMFVATVAVMAAVAMMLSTADAAPYEDIEGNYLYLVFVVMFSSAGCFLLARTLPGSAVWFVVACFFCAVVQAFYQSGELAFSFVVLVSSLALVIHRNFKRGRQESDVAANGGTSRGMAWLSAVAPVLVSAAAALCVWFGIIAPLNPGAFHITLVTDYKSMPIIELKGTGDFEPTMNTDYKTKNLADGKRYTTDDIKRGEDGKEIPAKSLSESQLKQIQGSSGSGQSSGSHDIPDEEEQEDPEYEAIAYSVVLPFIIIAIVVAALVVAGIVLFFVLRRRRRDERLIRMLAQEPSRQVSSIYLFLLSKLKMLGYDVPYGQTLTSFAKGRERSMDSLTLDTGVPFVALTDTYVRCAYGAHEPTEDEIVPFVAYYRGFWKAARSRLGNFKYFFKSFRLG